MACRQKCPRHGTPCEGREGDPEHFHFIGMTDRLCEWNALTGKTSLLVGVVVKESIPRGLMLREVPPE